MIFSDKVKMLSLGLYINIVVRAFSQLEVAGKGSL